MRTTALWSLALLAGSAVAAPGKRGISTDTTCTEEKQATKQTAPVYSFTSGSLSSPASKATPSSKSASWSSLPSSNNTSSASTGAGGIPSTVTVVVSTYTSVCPATKTWISGGSTSLSAYTSTTTITETRTSTISASPVYSPTWGQGSSNGAGGYSSQSETSASGSGAYSSQQGAASPTAYGTTVTAVMSVYTTVCPVTSTAVSAGQTVTSTWETVSTLTSTWYDTVTLSAAPSPSNYAPVVSGSAVIIPDVSTVVVSPIPTNYSPAESSSVGWGPGGYGGWSSGSSPAESSSIGEGNGGNGGKSSGSVYVSTVTQTQTIIVQKTTTAASGNSTMTKTYSGTSLHTSVYTTTITEGATSHWTTVQYGSTLFSYTIPVETSSAGSGSSPSGSIPAVSGKPSASRSLKPSGGAGKPSGSAQSSIKSVQSGVASKPTQAASRISSMPSGSFTSTKATSTSSSSTCKMPAPTASCIPCENQPSDDVDAHCGYTVDDDWYQVTPKTCKTVEYFWDITNGTVSPDGVERIGFMINGQMPGPPIEANWGDTVIVHITNKLENNGTSMHFHGLRQFWNVENDGVPSITQCALAPGHSQTYTWTASNYGTSWYHSHFAIQAYGGVFGPIIIQGPATAEYDDEQMVILQDWNHVTDDSIYMAAETQGPRTLDTGLINGLNVWNGPSGTTGERFAMTVVSGKRYRLRLVNTAIQSTFKFYIDSHKFQVIAMDFVPIVPYETEVLNINIGQRYDVVFTADQTPGNYWMRSDNQNACAVLTNALDIRGIVTYEGVAPATPTSTAYSYTNECVDEPLASLVPHVKLNAGASADQTIDETVAIGKPNGNYFKWTLSGTTFQSQWGEPTLNSIYANDTIPPYSGRLAIEVPNLQEWVYVIIDSPIPTPHPIHLHGHDFFVLAQGPGLYNPSVVLNTVNPPRRDTALMPYNVNPLNGAISGGHLVLAFLTDNPGAWLMHCHIGWHVSMGFALQIIEGQSLIKGTVDNSCQMDDVCKAWNEYSPTSIFDVATTDSGV